MEKEQKEYVYAIDGGGGSAYPERDTVIVGYLFIPQSSCMEHARLIDSMIGCLLS